MIGTLTSDMEDPRRARQHHNRRLLELKYGRDMWHRAKRRAWHRVLKIIVRRLM